MYDNLYRIYSTGDIFLKTTEMILNIVKLNDSQLLQLMPYVNFESFKYMYNLINKDFFTNIIIIDFLEKIYTTYSDVYEKFVFIYVTYRDIILDKLIELYTKLFQIRSNQFTFNKIKIMTLLANEDIIRQKFL